MTRLTLPVLLTSTLAFAQPAPRPIEVAPIVPVEWRLLAQPSVRDDIALTNEQKKALEQVEARQAIPYAALYWATRGAFTPEMAKSFKQSARDEFWTETLTKAQRTRLRQIEYQLKEREFGAHAALAMVARELGLRSEQLEDVTSIKGERVEAIAKLVTSGERFDKVKPKVESANTDSYEKIAEMLTKAQRERLKELKGKAFAGKIDPDFGNDRNPTIKNRPPQPGVRGHRLLLAKYPSALFGVYDLELRYLATPEVRRELKVTGDQAKKLDAAFEAWSKAHLELTGLDLDRSGQLHAQTAKALEETLNGDQRKRFGQIMMQRRQIVSTEAMCGHPDAVAALKLTPIQLKQLSDGHLVGDVLTKGQSDMLKQVAGAPFDIPAGPIDPLFGLHTTSSPAPPAPAAPVLAPQRAFARHFLVISDRLKLSDEQVKKLRELAEDEPKFFELIQRELGFADTAPVAGAGRGITPAGIVSDQFREAMEAQCWNVLDDKQQSTAKAIYGRRK